MKYTITSKLTAALVVISAISSANAALIVGQTIGVDFDDGGATPGAGAESNFLVVSGANAPGNVGTGLATTDITGGSTNGVTLDITGFQGFMGEGTIGFGAAGTGDYGSFPFTDATFNDGLFSNSNNPVVVTFIGLDNSLTYDVVGLISGGNTVVDGVAMRMTADGQFVDNSGAATSGGSSSGTLAPSILTGLETDGAGNLEVTFNTAAPFSFYGVSGLALTAQVPEPSSALLVALGSGLALLRRRR